MAARIFERARGLLGTSSSGVSLGCRIVRNGLGLFQRLLRSFARLASFLELPRSPFNFTCRPHRFELFAASRLFGLSQGLCRFRSQRFRLCGFRAVLSRTASSR